MKHLINNLYVSGQLQPRDFAVLAEQGVKIIINNRPDDEESGQLSAAAAQQLASEHGMEYHYLPMANGQPLPETLVSDFKQILDNNQATILAHCRSGMRSSFIWALGAIAAGEVSADAAIEAGQNAGIPLNNARAVLESVTVSD